MASSSSASHSSQKQHQHRCVFVGNIPYDTTEEQLIQICEEVGPVVSFRLVTDRETGKPKGYGFCEYKDEETALSARRNLQGYEINGRQLRVDFAENDKNADRNREQGRGGPGMVTNIDPQRQFGGPVLGDSSIDQPMGVSVAINAATAMARALGAAQNGNLSTQFGLQSQQALGSDKLTLHLAKMSRRQLNEIMSELKAMATQDKEQARQLLLTVPNLSKAIFQAQIMLGMVTQQMLLMPTIRGVAAPPIQPLSADAQQGQPQAAQNVPGLPPLPVNMMQFSVLPQAKETQVLTSNPSSSVQSQNTALLQFPPHNQIQLPQLPQSQGLQHGQLPLQSTVSTLPSIRPGHLGNLSVRSVMQAAPSPSLKLQMQAPLPQQGQTIISGYNPQMPISSAPPSLSDHGFQDSQRPQVSSVSAWAAKPGLLEAGKLVDDSSDQINRPSKLVRLNDGRSVASSMDVNMATSVAVPPSINSISGNQIPQLEAASNSEKQISQVQLPREVESALLQQVLNLTPEQLSSLPPDQQQQVIQLQQLLRQSST